MPQNPQSNGIVERVHQVIDDMLRCFNLDQLSSLQRQSELQSMGREALVLKRLSRVDGVQRYQDKEIVDDKLYVFVEKAPNTSLGQWLKTKPPRHKIIEVLIHLAETLNQIQSVGEPIIIHRSINLSNIKRVLSVMCTYCCSSIEGDLQLVLSCSSTSPVLPCSGLSWHPQLAVMLW